MTKLNPWLNMRYPNRLSVLLVSTLSAGSFLISCSTPQQCETTPVVTRNEPRPVPAERIYAQPVVVVPRGLTPPVAEIVRLTSSGMDEPVLMAFVENSRGPFHADAGQIISMRDAGVPPRVIEAMLRHPANLRALIPSPAQLFEVQTNDVEEVTNALVEQPTTLVVRQPAQTVIAVSVPAPAPVTIVNPVPAIDYHDALAPFGKWVESPAYGWVWQPTVVRTDRYWRPYHSNGRWIYTNHGWYWQSNYSWGHVPFHYGRWTRDTSVGWVWVPDTVWGPAWVSWRYGNEHVGWAPLPPQAHYSRFEGFRYRGSRVSSRFEFGLRYSDYTFCPLNGFYSSTPYRHFVNRSRNTVYYNQTVVVNNFNQQSGAAANRTAPATPANTGVPVDDVSRVARTPVRKVRVLDVDPTAGRTAITPGVVVNSGNDLAVYRQPLRKPASPPAVSSSVSSRTAITVTRTRRTAPPKKYQSQSNYGTSRSPSSSYVVSSPAPARTPIVQPETSRSSSSVGSRSFFSRPTARPSSSRSSFTSSNRRSSPSSSQGNSSSSSRVPATSRSPIPSSSSSSRIVNRTPVAKPAPRVTATKAPAAPPRVTIRPMPAPAPRALVRAPVVVRAPAVRKPTVAPPITRTVPTSRPQRKAAPAPPVRTPTPARPPAAPSGSTSSKSSDDGSSSKPARPSRRPQRKN
jgi:hypothetical protein